MPIDREDGLHWCAPDLEKPDKDGKWKCPGCKKVWLYDEYERLWEQPQDREARAAAEALQKPETAADKKARKVSK